MAVATGTALALAALGAGTGASMYSAKKQADAMKQQATLSQPGQQARTELLNQGNLLNQTGGQLIQRGDQSIADVEAYWKPLLRGNRAEINQALAPETAQITDIYRGAAKNIDRSGVQGAQRDEQKGELNRQRAGQLALMRPTARRDAADALGKFGAGYLSEGTNLLGEAGRAYAGVYSGERGSADSAYGPYVAAQQQNSNSLGRGLGGLLFNVVSMYGQNKMPKPLPTTTYKPPMSPYPTAPPMNRP